MGVSFKYSGQMVLIVFRGQQGVSLPGQRVSQPPGLYISQNKSELVDCIKLDLAAKPLGLQRNIIKDEMTTIKLSFRVIL